jgi:TolB-like protein
VTALPRRSALAVGACLCSALPPLRGQCPDGSAPPCHAPRTPAPNSIAVLYFDNLSRDSGDTYIADGLTDEIIVRLQHVQRLDVKSRYEVRRFRGTRIPDARSVGHELGVAYLVTGIVRPSASRMRVSYELARTNDGRTLASDILDTTAADEWAITNAVALAIAQQVAGQLAPAERSALTHRLSRDAKAIDLYRRGKFLVDRGIRGDRFDVMMALGFFQAAFERDSSFAEALANIAEAWSWLEGYFPNRLVAEQGRAAARRALALDSASSRASTALAYAMATVDYDWTGAERLLRRAIGRDARGTDTRLMLSMVLSATGRLDEAWETVEAAWAIDSLNPRNGYYVWLVLSSAHRYDDLLHWSERLAQGDPSRSMMRFTGYLATHRPDSAVAQATDCSFCQTLALAAEGRLVEARDAATRWVVATDSQRTQGLVPDVPDITAAVWAAVGDRDRAFAALERSFAFRSGSDLPWIKYLPTFDNLHDDPRFHDLLRRMHLEP